MESNVSTKEDVKMIFDLIKEFKQDINRRFEDVDRRFEEVKDLIREEKHDREKMEEKLDKVYESRDRVKISFGWQWGTVSMLIAIVAAFLGGGLAFAFAQ